MLKFKIHIVFVFVLVFHFCFSQLDKFGNKTFTKGDTLRGALLPERTCYNVLSYDLDIKVDIDNKFISGSNTITFSAEQDIKRLQIDLFANLKIDKIEFNGYELSYNRLFNAVFVEFPEIVKKGSIEKIKIMYSGNPQSAKHAPWDGGFSWKSDPHGKPWVGVSCQGTGASCWWPCKDHQSDEPENMYIRITVPVGLLAISNGRLINTSVINKDWITYSWYVSYPINNYNVTLNIANYLHFSDVYKNLNFKDSLTLDYFVLPANLEKAKKHFKQVKPMLDCYYQLFGEYPFVNDGYKLVETPYLFM